MDHCCPWVSSEGSVALVLCRAYTTFRQLQWNVLPDLCRRREFTNWMLELVIMIYSWLSECLRARPAT